MNNFLKNFSLAGALVFFFMSVSCVKESDRAAGEISLSLETDDRTSTAVETKAETVPSTDDFAVEIFNSRGTRIFREPYSSVRDRQIALNSGEFRLLAFLGDSARVAFSAPFYQASTAFTVHPHTAESLSLTARITNVCVDVEYDPAIAKTYPDFYSTLTLEGTSKMLTYSKSESRSGFFPAGNLLFEFHGIKDGNDSSYKLDPIACVSNDHLVLKISLGSGTNPGGSGSGTNPGGSGSGSGTSTGELSVSVKIDNSVSQIVNSYVVPLQSETGGPVVISASGYRFDFAAEAGLAACIATVDSPAWTAAGLPSPLDFCSLSSSEADKISRLGIRYIRSMADCRVAFVDFSGFAKYVAAGSSFAGSSHSISLLVKDDDGNSRESSRLSFVSGEIPDPGTPDPPVDPEEPVASLSIATADVWATKVVDVEVLVESGEASDCVLQYSADGKSWVDVAPASVDGNKLNFGPVTGLEPDSSYSFRTIFAGKTDSASEPTLVHTEKALQLDNPSFEDWSIEEFSYTTKVLFVYSTATREWYLPWTGSNAWWAVNSKRTMPSQTTTEYQEYKSRPTVAYVTTDPYHGGKAAQLASTGICSGATALGLGLGTSVHAPGELFLGSADDSGAHLSDGHSFASRPSALKFMYKFGAYNSESWSAVVRVKSADATVLAEASAGASEEVSAWTAYTLELDYSHTDKKAASIEVEFSSSTAETPSTRYTTIEYAGSNQKASIGTVLTLDALELIYE